MKRVATGLMLALAAYAPVIAQTTLNLRDADVRAFIQDASRVTGRNFIIDGRVQGKVTVVSDRPLSRSEYFEVFLSTLRANGLGLGAGMDNAVVMDDYRVLNSDGLRYDDELVKHKILDAMGDLYLVGRPLLAAYEAFRSGHAMNNKLLRELLSQPDAYEIVSFDDEKHAPAGFAQVARAW